MTEQEHVHDYQPVRNDWGEIIGHRCSCGAFKSL